LRKSPRKNWGLANRPLTGVKQGSGLSRSKSGGRKARRRQSRGGEASEGLKLPWDRFIGVGGCREGGRRRWTGAVAVVLRRARGGDLGPVSFSGRWGSRSRAPLGAEGGRRRVSTASSAWRRLWWLAGGVLGGEKAGARLSSTRSRERRGNNLLCEANEGEGAWQGRGTGRRGARSSPVACGQGSACAAGGGGRVVAM